MSETEVVPSRTRRATRPGAAAPSSEALTVPLFAGHAADDTADPYEVTDPHDTADPHEVADPHDVADPGPGRGPGRARTGRRSRSAGLVDGREPAGPAAGSRPGRRWRPGEPDAPRGRHGAYWWWVAGAVAALVLVGRGVIGVSDTGSGGSATAVGVSASVSTEPGTEVTGPAPATFTPVPTTPPGVARVTLPQITPSAAAGRSAPARTAAGAASPSATAPHAALTCTVQAAQAPFWGGYTEGLTIVNTGRTTLHGWRFTFRLPDGQRLTNSWNGRFTASGTLITVTDVGYNDTLAPKASTQIGYQAQFGPFGGGPGSPGSSPAGPYGFALDGVTCAH